MDAVLHRPNFTVITNAHVSRITFKGKRATGLENFNLRAGQKQEIIEAKKEVILSAGGTNSPQVLKLSGNGPEAELNSFDIDTVHHLPGATS